MSRSVSRDSDSKFRIAFLVFLSYFERLLTSLVKPFIRSLMLCFSVLYAECKDSSVFKPDKIFITIDVLFRSWLFYIFASSNSVSINLFCALLAQSLSFSILARTHYMIQSR